MKIGSKFGITNGGIKTNIHFSSKFVKLRESAIHCLLFGWSYFWIKIRSGTIFPLCFSHMITLYIIYLVPGKILFFKSVIVFHGFFSE